MLRFVPALAAAVLASGCGYIGGPMPPLANVPARVADLAAVQRGSRILVNFTVPTLTTERLAIKKPVRLDLRLGPAAEPFDAGQWSAHATPSPEGRIADGIARYEIPAAPWTGKEVVIAVSVIGSNGKESGWSNFAAVPVIAPPQPPSNVKAEATAAGVGLQWSARGDRFRISRRTGTGGLTPVATVPGSEWTDPGTEFGKPYTYVVQAIYELGDHREAESDASTPVTITPIDTFAPAAPIGLRANAAPDSVELAWEQNQEPDVAGYRVYRALAGGAFEKIADVNQIPAYSDHQVEHGKTYRYALTAIDKTGNESSRSEPAEVFYP